MLRTLHAAGLLALIGAAPPAPVVDTAVGTVQGTRADGVEAFLGLPYAAAPVGPLRWRAPQPASAWNGVRAADRFGPICAQGLGGAFGPYTAEFIAQPPASEDCLTLNVWRPAGAAHRLLPVFVFIHGGAFQGGSGSVALYDGAALARRGLVVITLNYRVGVFGFFAHPGLAAEAGQGQSAEDRSEGNYGLLDQVAALRWIRANVARFGGDPARVTVSGESAGAASVNDLLVSPLARGLFARAVSFSGPSMAVDVPTLAQGEREGAALGAALGAADLAALRALPAERLIAATGIRPPAGGGAPRFIWIPHRDGVVLPHDPVDAAAPVAMPVPLLGGYNAAEMIDLSVTTPQAFEMSVRARYGAFADRLLALYPHATPDQAIASNRLIAADRYMAGMVLWSRLRTRTAHQPIWLYRHDHAYPPAAGGPAFGAFHSSELAYVFGNLGMGPRQFTAADRALVRQWQDRLVAFARSGSPGRDWPAVNAAPGRVRVIGDRPGIAPAVSSPARMAVWREYAASGGALGLN